MSREGSKVNLTDTQSCSQYSSFPQPSQSGAGDVSVLSSALEINTRNAVQLTVTTIIITSITTSPLLFPMVGSGGTMVVVAVWCLGSRRCSNVGVVVVLGSHGRSGGRSVSVLCQSSAISHINRAGNKRHSDTLLL